MEEIMLCVISALTVIANLIFFAFLMRTVFPKYILRVKYAYGETQDRGIKRLKYPSGRAVVYEPHPSIRKYVNEYSLFTEGGYKYIRCKIDRAVTCLRYNVVTYNRKNKIIDVVKVTESTRSEYTEPVMLHHDTSYVSLLLLSVNGESAHEAPMFKIKPLNAVLYAIAVTVTVFLEMTLMASFTRELFDLISLEAALKYDVSYFIHPSLLIGALYSLIVIRSIRRKV